MNKEELLQMTTKEIETFLNNNISTIDFKSDNEVEVKGKMIDNVKLLFNNNTTIEYLDAIRLK